MEWYRFVPWYTLFILLIFVFLVLLADVAFNEIRIIWSVVSAIILGVVYYRILYITSVLLNTPFLDIFANLRPETYYKEFYKEKSPQTLTLIDLIKVVDNYIALILTWASTLMIFYYFDRSLMRNEFFEVLDEPQNPPGGNIAIWVQFVYFVSSFATSNGQGPIVPIHPASQVAVAISILTFFFYNFVSLTIIVTLAAEARQKKIREISKKYTNFNNKKSYILPV